MGSDLREGTVTGVQSRMCRVELDDGPVDCRVRGVLFRDEKDFSSPVAVGDRVVVQMRRQPPPVVVEVRERRNCLVRRQERKRKRQIMAANLDQAVIVSACAEPRINPRLVDRMLVAAEHAGYRAIVVINKIDMLVDPSDLDFVREIYEPLGYPVILTSAADGAGIDRLRDELRDRISIFYGPSGVGKSALLTAVEPELALVSGDVSAATGKGRHTTTAVSLLRLGSGGFVVDTPGVREFGVDHMEPADVGRCFVEFLPLIDGCKFRRCTHTHEIGCAVKQAVSDATIDPDRYDSYLRIIDSI